MTNSDTLIPSGWKINNLEKIINIQSGKSRPKNGNKYPVYGGNGILGFADEFNIDREQIIVGRVGAYCGCIYFEKNKFWLSDNALGVLNKDNSDIKFIYYLLKKLDLNKKAIGGAQPLLTQGLINQLEVIIPENKFEQQAIATILSSLDDKIELLREKNKTLETLAQTIFKEWFVKFNFPGSTGKMINSDLGEIPEGWKVRQLGKEFNITIGRTPPRAEPEWFSLKPIGKKWISIKDMGNSGVYIFDTSEYLTDEAIQKFNVPIIPENTTILSFKMTVGKLTITSEKMLSNEAIAHLKINKTSRLSTEYIYCYLQNLDFNSLGSTSSIVTAINSTMIKNIHVMVPSNACLEKFDKTIKPIFAKIKVITIQIQTLSKLRDTLLPKLMRGEIRVNNIN